MEPISIPGSMASPLSANRRRHVSGAMTNTHALRGTSPMSGPDIQQAYKEYERSFDELSQASAASPPLFRRRWGDGGVEDDDVSVLTAPVVAVQRRPSQRELERELVRADVAGRVTDHNSTATAITRRAPDDRSVVSEASTASAFDVQRKGHLGVVEKFHTIEVAPVRDKHGAGAPARCEQAPARAQPRATVAAAVASDDQASVVTAVTALELETLRPSRTSLASSPTKSLATASPSKMSHIFSDTATTATATASPSKSHIFGDALSVSTTTTHVQHVRAPGAGRAVTCADLAAFNGDATHLERAVEERSVAFSPPRSRQMVVERRRALGRCLTPEDALLPRTLRKAIKRTSPPKQRKSALPSPIASPPARRPAPLPAYVRPVPTRDGVRSLLRTFPRHWTDIAEHTNWGRPEPVRKDVVLCVDERPGVDPTSYRTHHLRRPDALKPFDHLLDPGRNLASNASQGPRYSPPTAPKSPQKSRIPHRASQQHAIDAPSKFRVAKNQQQLNMPATRSSANNNDGLAFEAVAVTLEIKKGVQKTIVRDARGSVGKHGLLAILGPSGAGKTTLLAALAKERPCDAGSKIWRPAGGANFLPQDDRLLPFLTVRETLQFAAELRWDGLDSHWDTSVKRAERAESVLETLGLSDVGDTRVGSALKRGVSGGERRRTALGVELVLIPSLLLADEPTSGLDSTAALQLAILLREAEATVVASVHQPGARVFQQFTDVVVLAPGGGTAYAGPADTAASTCASLCKVKVPPLTSAAEVLLDLVDDPATRSVLVSQKPSTTTRPSYEEDDPQLSTRSRFRPLLTRAWLNNARAPAATVAAVGRSVTMALLVGALYSGSRGTSTQTAVSDRTGALFFVLVNQAFSAMASLRVFIEERSVFEHERRRRAYSTRDYFLAKSLAELPIQGAVALLFAGMAYAMVGLRASLFSFGGHCIILALATLVAESLVIWVGAGASDARTAVVICPVVLSTSLLFGGLFVSLASLPSFLAPLQYLSLFRYGFAGLLKLEFQHADAVFDCSSADKELLAQRVIDAGAPAKLLGKLIKKLPCPTPDGATHVKRVLGDDAASRPIAMDAGALLALLIAFRVLALRALERRTRSAIVAKAKQA